MENSLIAFAIVLVLIFLRVPLVFSMSLVGFVGIVLELGLNPALAAIPNTIIEAGMSYSLSVLPLFVLMGNFAVRARLSEELYAASYAFLGHRRGGLASATIVASGGFGAICGSSIATAATMAKVAMPSMRKYGYSDALATGSIAAGGTLGILIPPSVIMIIYGILTETNIGALFAAGVLPALALPGIAPLELETGVPSRDWLAAGCAAAAELLDRDDPLVRQLRDRFACVTELEYRHWCMRHPDDDYRLHIAHWSWMKTRVPPQWWPKLAQWPINAGESYWLHRTGTAGAGRERRSSHLWKWNGTIAAILKPFVDEAGSVV